jgi:predicted ATP-binding protein involved in virulence
MRIKQLQISNCRGLINSNMTFQPGMNLIVGVNGAGKSTILDALCVLLSQVLADITNSVAPSPAGFELDDIAHGKNTLDAHLQFETGEKHQLSLRLLKQREKVTSVVNIREEKSFRSGVEETSIREQSESTEDGVWLTYSETGQTANIKLEHYPLLLNFSVERSRPTYEKAKRLKTVHPAYMGAFSSKRGFNINDVVEWWESKEAIALEDPESSSGRQLKLVRETLKELCPQYANWRLESDDGKKVLDLWVDKTIAATQLNDAGELKEISKQQTLRVRQLSDGERSIIAMVFDITRRLILLNDKEDDPVKKGKGIVLIDEIDLHLHPQWQRTIVVDLPRVFPGIQFIATTHSPQTIGETAPGHVLVLQEGGKVQVEPESFGRSSGWILRHIMGADECTVELKEGLVQVEQFIDDDEYGKARELIGQLRSIFGNDSKLIGAEASLNRWEFGDDEED